MNKSLESNCCDGCCPSSSPVDRRAFLSLSSAAAAGGMILAGGGTRAADPSASPNEAELAAFEKLIPRDKQLDPNWIKSLTERGGRTTYRGDQLQWIGMPIGGIGAGQLYLGGDGQLWRWDIFNKLASTGDGGYSHPPQPSSPLDQGFAIQITSEGKTQMRRLNRAGFKEISFTGEYPIGYVEYRDPDCPVAVSLEVFSPFAPLSPEDSALPATLLHFTLRNTSGAKLQVEIGGWLENAVCLYTGAPGALERVNSVGRTKSALGVECSVRPAPSEAKSSREDIPFETFEKPDYEGWTVTGTAFDKSPIEKSAIPAYQGDVGGEGKRVVNSHNVRKGEDVGGGDKHTGTLTSKPFKIERNYIRLWIGGGNHPGKTCVNLLLDDKVARSITGRNENRMRIEAIDVRDLQGKTARLQIVDLESGPWGNIGVDEIVFTDRPARPVDLAKQHDHGTLCIALLEPLEADRAMASLPAAGPVPAGLFPDPPRATPAPETAAAPFGQKLVGAVTRSLSLAPGESAVVTFAMSWCFANLELPGLVPFEGRHYGKQFASARAVIEHLAAHHDPLSQLTRLWHDTWYDSTLPYWLLDRTLLNASILATSTCYWLGNGRFYGWEGVGCCEGTCTHVWQYAQAAARLFPQLERTMREIVDLDIAFDAKTGMIGHRGERLMQPAIDGQAGTILRFYREHQMSADGSWLSANWPKIKLAMQYLIAKDGNADGILEGPQHNTLDAEWFGKSPWLSGMYHAALRAAEEMARDQKDEAFARTCRAIFEKGREQLDRVAWKEDYGYYIHLPDPPHLAAVGAYFGSHIDQVYGQSWAHQVGLGPIMSPEHVRRALQSLWRFNFAPDVGPYRAVHKAGRWYAMPGEAGLLMVTHPFGQGREFKDHPSAWSAMYFNECMNGFEYQAAWHMICEGLVQEGLAVTRAIHDRYHAAKRNPWNEVECGDHYARSMASYGVFLAVCGFEYHGPRGHIGFAPRVSPEKFRAPFTSAQGWGTYSQHITGSELSASIALAHGQLRLRAISLAMPAGLKPTNLRITIAGKSIPARFSTQDNRVQIALSDELLLHSGERMELVVS